MAFILTYKEELQDDFPSEIQSIDENSVFLDNEYLVSSDVSNERIIKFEICLALVLSSYSIYPLVKFVWLFSLLIQMEKIYVLPEDTSHDQLSKDNLYTYGVHGKLMYGLVG